MPNLDLLPSYCSRSMKTSSPGRLQSWSFRTGLSNAVLADVTDDVRGALDAIDKNEELIKLTLAVLMTRE